MSARDADAEALYRAPRLYDLLCPALREGDAELTYWRGVCDGARDVLELGCGTGRVAVPLARGGLRVTGLGRPRRHRLPLLDAPVHDPEAGRPLMVEETLDYDHVTQTTRGRLHFSYLAAADDDRPDARDFLVAPADLRVLYPRELEALLHYNGYRVLARFGDFARGAFTRASLLQNVVCRPASS